MSITDIFQELNLYDSVFYPCLSGDVVIVDAHGLSSKLSFDGSEVINVYMTKQDDIAVFKKSFRIYKQSNRKNINSTSEIYILHFISEEYILSQQLKINKTYNSTYSEVVNNILLNNLIVDPKNIAQIEKSQGICDIVIPNKTPFQAISFCKKRAVNSKVSPTFLFFENADGYNFVTASTLLGKAPLFSLHYEPKNLSESTDKKNELLGIRAFEVLTNHDYISNINSGLYAGTFVGVDIRNRIIARKKVNFNEIMQKNLMANKIPDIGIVDNKLGLTNIEMYNSKVVLYPTSIYDSQSPYVKENYPEKINTEDKTYDFVLQRTASLRNIFQKRLRLVLPGNFYLTSGYTVELKIPLRGLTTGSDSIDKVISGKYIIIATRHIIRYDRHETIIDVTTDSTNEDFVSQSTQKQTEALEE